MKIILYLTVITLLITTVASDSAAPPYTNHTVGGSAGWFFNTSTNSSSTDYSKWAADQTFNLGDFLIFNTNTNQTVIQTFNETAYQKCDADDTSETDTSVYSGGNEIGKEVTFAVPLTIEGSNYFFSDTDDGVQCAQGMAFKINVKHGRGLPPSLNQPPPPPYVEPPPSNSDQSPPSTATTNQQERFYNGGERSGANMRMWVGVMFLFGLLVV
ncbi:Plastocyanin-like [Macleaya cordata]|uniref:Plastocyanin-like n=1 Tax=Macleaya cordata TaxID=56857 RepID=A0A200PMN5_MACCD|nr:Plastocyanin-like [Macleaya cordata]